MKIACTNKATVKPSLTKERLMPKAAPKSLEIAAQLVNYLRTGTKLDDFSFHRFFRDVEKLNDRQSEDYLKALACGASGRKDEAIEFFEASLTYGVDTYALNYAVYLEEYGSHRELYDVVSRLVQSYGAKTMLQFAWETRLFTGEIEDAVHYAERFIAAADQKDAEEMREDATGIVIDTTRFKESAGLSDEEYKDIAQRVIDIVDQYQVRALSLEFLFVPEEKTASYIMKVKSDDVEVLSDMNLDIAFSLAENESLAGKKFSVWYQGSYGEDKNACN